MEADPVRVCELLVGLGDVEVVGIDDETDEPSRVHNRRRAPRPDCGPCGGPLWSDGRSESSWGTPKYPPSHIYAQALMIRPTTRTNSTRDCSLATSTTSTSPNHTNTSQTRVDTTSTPIIQILECLPSPIPDVAPHIQPATLTPLTPPSNTKRHIHALGRLVETTDGGHRGI